ncbi:hypothetical protein CEXT_814431 [Caerostris extrusa]|uniref:Transmembrane protein n=1 Tax=Caerostris extrusa TaxID=172846 RepID=A0AAV4P461_CAEEX|nr:hypothetical protein CEXT_814431 [Caerostris extrusa]
MFFFVVGHPRGQNIPVCADDDDIWRQTTVVLSSTVGMECFRSEGLSVWVAEFSFSGGCFPPLFCWFCRCADSMYILMVLIVAMSSFGSGLWWDRTHADVVFHQVCLPAFSSSESCGWERFC